jgi:aminomethyltransferase
MPLYGHELSREVNPLEAGLGKFVHLDKEFVGRDALVKARDEGLPRTLVGLEVDGKRIPRQGATVHREGKRIGVVTSGTFSPSLQKVITLAYLEGETPPVGSRCEVDVRGKMLSVSVTEIPFYRRAK